MSRTRRHFTATLQALLVAPLLVAAVVAGMTNEAPVGGFVGTPAEVQAAYDRAEPNVPDWTDAPAALRAGCVDGGHYAGEFLPSETILSTRDGVIERVPFDNDTLERVRLHPIDQVDGLWVIGMCR